MGMHGNIHISRKIRMGKCSFQFKSQGGSKDQESMRWYSANQMGHGCPILVKFHQCHCYIPFNPGADPCSLLSTGNSQIWMLTYPPNWSQQAVFHWHTSLRHNQRNITAITTLMSTHGDKHRRRNLTEILVLSCSECAGWHWTERRKTQKQSEGPGKYTGWPSRKEKLWGKYWQIGNKTGTCMTLCRKKVKTRECGRIVKCQGMGTLQVRNRQVWGRSNCGFIIIALGINKAF